MKIVRRMLLWFTLFLGLWLTFCAILAASLGYIHIRYEGDQIRIWISPTDHR